MVNSYEIDWESLELDPTPRDNTHIWTKSVPVDVTLAVAGTAENLFSINTERPTKNIATNPSFETGAPPTGYVAVGSALSQSAVIARNGTNSILVNPDNLAVGEGFYWITPSLLGSNNRNIALTVSIYLNDNVDSGNGARIMIRDSAGTTLLATGNTVALSSAWQRSTASLLLVNRTTQSYRIYVETATNHNTNFYSDAFQVELSESNTPSTYTDGSLGVNYEWLETANASMSVRRRGLVSVRGYSFHVTGDIYFAEDQTASVTTGEYIRAGTDWWTDFPVHIKSNLSFVNVNPGETPRITGKVWGVHYGRM